VKVIMSRCSSGPKEGRCSYRGGLSSLDDLVSQDTYSLPLINERDNFLAQCSVGNINDEAVSII